MNSAKTHRNGKTKKNNGHVLNGNLSAFVLSAKALRELEREKTTFYKTRFGLSQKAARKRAAKRIQLFDLAAP